MMAPTPEPLELGQLDFQAGDVLAFSGRGWESFSIKAVSCSWGQWARGEAISHVGICATVGSRVLLFESTTENEVPCYIRKKCVKGAQAHEVEERLRRYDGKVWLLRLVERERLTRAQSRKLTDFLKHDLGKPYDRLGASFAGSHWTKKWLAKEGWINFNLSAYFCDEWVAAALMDIDKIERFNGSIVTPAWLIWYLVDIGLYQPIQLINTGK